MRRGRLLRLGLFQLAAGSSSVIFLGTVNRVMHVEFGLDVFLVSLLVGGGHYLGGLVSIPFGHYSDTHPVRGYRRTVYALAGALAAAACLAAVPFMVQWLAAHQTPLAWLVGFLFFLTEGIATAIGGTAYLALLADLTTERERGPATGVAWTMLMVGIIFTAIASGAIISPYSFAAFETLAWLGAGFALLLAVVALLGQEPRDLRPQSAWAAAGPGFAASLRLLLASRQARWFAAFLWVALFSFFMYDVLLEPFGGRVFDLPVAVTTRFNAYLGVGVILGMLLGGSVLIPRFGKPRITALGCWLMGGGFSLLALAGFAEAAWALNPAITLLGFGSGLFTVGGVALMMDMTASKHTGLFAGAWTLVRNLATGPASVTGGALVAGFGGLGATAGQAFGLVFALEAVGVMVAVFLLAHVGVQNFQREVASMGEVAAEAMD
jgi:BCD family chlorophyll transporter-like MFS transporter